jgi:hypothetical protein
MVVLNVCVIYTTSPLHYACVTASTSKDLKHVRGQRHVALYHSVSAIMLCSNHCEGPYLDEAAQARGLVPHVLFDHILTLIKRHKRVALSHPACLVCQFSATSSHPPFHSAWLLTLTLPQRMAAELSFLAQCALIPPSCLRSDIILPGTLHDNVRQMAAASANTKKHGAPFRHMLFYGA